MKKVVYFIVIMLFSIYLSGCKNEDVIDKLPECTPESVEERCLTVTTGDQLEDKDLSEDTYLTVTPGDQLEVKDLSEEFSIDANMLTTYTVSNDISRYVNIEEFIQFFEGVIHPLGVENDKDLTLSLEIETENEIGENAKYNARMVFNSDNETIYFSDFHYLEYLNVDAETDFGEGLVVVDYITESKSLEKTMDLKPYGMNIVEKDNQYYIPLYLANLLLTGDSAHIYDVDYTVYLFDNFSDAMFTEDLTTYPKDEDYDKLFSNSKNFLALLFDYYYGLKDYKQVDSYIKEFDDYELEEQENFLDYYNELTEFLIDNDDLHTWLITTGYNLEMKSYTPDLSNLKKSSNIYRHATSSFVSHQCSLQTEEITYEEIDGVMYIKINAFSEQTDELLKPVMETASQYDDIVFDVKCNGGGMISGVIHLLSYMTDEPIEFHYRDEVLDINNTVIYETTESNYMDKNYYVVTSPVTFSAANLFVSIVKEKELGQVIGENSLGGACAIKTVVLPDGSIIQMSGPNGFTTTDYETIENGVAADLKLIANDYDETYEKRVTFIVKSNYIYSSIDYQNFDDEMTMDDQVFHPEKPIIYFINTEDQTLHAYNYETQDLNTITFEFPVKTIEYHNNEIYVTLSKEAENSTSYNKVCYSEVLIFDADTMNLNSSFDVQINVFSMTIDSGGYIYVSSDFYTEVPRSYYTDEKLIQSYNRNGELIDEYSFAISYRTLIVADPLDNKIYTLDTRVSPKDLHAFVTFEGRFIDNYDSTYHGDYKFGNDCPQISPEGSFIFNTSGNIFTSSDIDSRNDDMIHMTSLPSEYQSFAFDIIGNRFYAISGSKIDVFDYTTFERLGYFSIEGLGNNPELFVKAGQLIVISSKGVIILPKNEEGLLVQSSDVEHLDINTSISSKIDIADYKIYRFTVEESGKYFVEINTAYLYEFLIYNEYGQIINNNTTQDNIPLILTKGMYYIQVTNMDSIPLDYTIKILKIEHDDFGNDLIGDVESPVGYIKGERTLDGRLDYHGDIDVFKLSLPMILNLRFHTDADIKLKVVKQDEIEFILGSNAFIEKEYTLYKEDATYVYLIVYSDSQAIGDYTLELLHYNIETDETNSLPNDDVSLSIDNELMGYFHDSTDVDVMKINIDQDGIYTFIGTGSWETYMELYDQLGNLIEVLKDETTNHRSVNLVAGDYYIKIFRSKPDNEYSGGYSIKIHHVLEEQIGVAEFDINGETPFIWGVADYVGDSDQYHFTVTEDREINLFIPKYSNYRLLFDIRDSEGNIILADNEDTYKGWFTQGEYTIEVKITTLHNGEAVDYQLFISDSGDYPSELVNDDQLGQFEIGKPVIIYFDSYNDVDGYYFDITELGNYTLTFGSGYNFRETEVRIYNAEKAFMFKMYSGSIHEFTEGRYYVTFENSIEPLMVLISKDVPDDYLKIAPGRVELNSVITGRIEQSFDVDYFKITMTEETALRMTYSKGISMVLTNSEGRIIPSINLEGREAVYYLSAGTYQLAVDRSEDELEAVFIGYSIELDSYTIDDVTDDAINFIYHDDAEYDCYNPLEVITGNIDYIHDVDVYILKSEVHRDYDASILGDVEVVRFGEWYLPGLDEENNHGYNYTYVIVSSKTGEPEEYSITFHKH